MTQENELIAQPVLTPEQLAQSLAARAVVAPEPVSEGPKVERRFAKQVMIDNAAKEAPEDPIVTVRVTKKGADKISTGTHVDTLGDELYAANEMFTAPQSVALVLEDRGFAEIQ